MASRDYCANVERFTGFGALYDNVRPEAPRGLAELLLGVAQVDVAGLVVDLGSGTGLSTRYWIGRAKSILGVEPSDSMRHEAERKGGNITYVGGYAHATGLPDGCADIVVCAQSFHWMDPVTTLAESARIIRSGGVFATYDYDWPPSTSSGQVDRTFTSCMAHARELERVAGVDRGLHQWEKARHLERLEKCGRFRFVRECVLSHTDEGGADRIVGLLLSQGFVQSLLKAGKTEADLGIAELREAAETAFGSGTAQWNWSARLRLGVK